MASDKADGTGIGGGAGRRGILCGAAAGAAAGLAAGGVASPAVAQAQPAVRWRCTSSFPKTLDMLYGLSVDTAKRVGEATDGRFAIQCFGPGEIVPGPAALDGVQNGSVEMASTATYYWHGKDPAFNFGTGLAFGLNARMQAAWFQHGGAGELFQEFLGTYNVHGIAAGNTGVQMGGWFRREVKSLADVQGLKFRLTGLAGRVVAKIGGVPLQVPPGDTYAALERGTIDAAEMVGPYDDERMGLHRVAPYYYFPGWWETGSQTHVLVNLQKWQELPRSYQAALTSAAEAAGAAMLAKYDAQNPAALRRLVGRGAQLRPFPNDVMEAGFKASLEIYAEIAAGNAAFKRLYDSFVAFRAEQYLWWQVAELSHDAFMVRNRAKFS